MFGGVLLSYNGTVAALISGNLSAEISRLITIEMSERIPQPLTEFPDEDAPLPSAFAPTSMPNIHEAKISEPSPATQVCNVSWMARQVQTLRLYDQFLKLINSSSPEETKLVQLKLIGEQLQDFLTFAIHQRESDSWKMRSAVTATILR